MHQEGKIIGKDTPIYSTSVKIWFSSANAVKDMRAFLDSTYIFRENTGKKFPLNLTQMSAK